MTAQTLGDAVVNTMRNLTPLQEAFAQGESLATGFAVKMGSTITRTAAAVVTPILAGLSLKGVMGEWMGKEVAINNLSTALKASGENVELLLPRYIAFSDKMQSITTYTNDAILSSMAHAKSLGIEGKQLEEVSTAAIGLAAKIGVGMETAMQLLIRASHGSTQRLKLYGITLDENATKQEKFKQLLQIGTEAMPLAEGKTKTLSGQLTVLKNIWGDAQATIGRGLAEPLGASMDAAKAKVTAFGTAPVS